MFSNSPKFFLPKYFPTKGKKYHEFCAYSNELSKSSSGYIPSISNKLSFILIGIKNCLPCMDEVRQLFKYSWESNEIFPESIAMS